MGLAINGEGKTKAIVEAAGRSYDYFDTDFSGRASLYAAIKL
ncbi:MAG: hypothetical protein ACI81V_000052 [Lentimonas sp.]|jgi:hypothetical protein